LCEPAKKKKKKKKGQVGDFVHSVHQSLKCQGEKKVGELSTEGPAFQFGAETEKKGGKGGGVPMQSACLPHNNGRRKRKGGWVTHLRTTTCWEPFKRGEGGEKKKKKDKTRS